MLASQLKTHTVQQPTENRDQLITFINPLMGLVMQTTEFQIVILSTSYWKRNHYEEMCYSATLSVPTKTLHV